MPLRVPLFNDAPAYRMSTRLDEVVCRFEFRWNERDLHPDAQSPEDCFWRYALLDDADVPFYGFRRLTLGADLLDRCADSRRPPGKLILIDTSLSGREPGLKDLGSRVILYYFTATELSLALGA